MKSKLNYSIILLSFLFSMHEKANAQAPNWSWAKSFDGGLVDNIGSIAIDASGNVYNTGQFYGIEDFDPGPGVYNLTSANPSFKPEVYISKLNNAGNFVWAKALGGVSSGGCGGISIAFDTAGNVYTAGHFAGTVDFDPGPGIFNLTSMNFLNDIFISELDSSGNFIWAKQMGGSISNFVYSIALDATGNVYTTGMFHGVTDFDPGPGVFNLTSAGFFNIFISKLDNAGNFLWAKQIEGTDENDARSITIDSSDNVYITGEFYGTADFDPDSLGNYNLTSAGYHDIFVAKLDSAGNFVWAKRIGSANGNESGYSITLDASANVYIMGPFNYSPVDFDPDTGIFYLYSNSGANIFISKLDSSGNFVLAKSLGGVTGGVFAEYSGSSIVLDDSANIYTTGYFTGSADFDPDSLGTFNLTSLGNKDIFVSKLDSAGNFAWATGAGGINDESGKSIDIDTAGNLFINGLFQGPSIAFGADTVFAFFTNSKFVAKLGTSTINTTIYNPEIFANSFLVFPNPASNQIIIGLNGNNKNVKVTITDITGKIIYTSVTSEQEIEINTADFSDGIYFLQMQSRDFVETKKLIVAR